MTQVIIGTIIVVAVVFILAILFEAMGCGFISIALIVADMAIISAFFIFGNSIMMNIDKIA